MQDFKIEGEKGNFFIPSVFFEAETGKLEIAGESYLEDTAKFYEPVLIWLREYLKDTSNAVELKVKLTYFNTSSSKYLSLILGLLKEYENEGGDVTIVWYHLSTDEDMVEEIEDFATDADVDVIMYPVKNLEDLQA